jgi:hypothetical protein
VKAPIQGLLAALLMVAVMAENAAADNDKIAELAGQLSAGDVSVLREGLKGPENHMMTTEGSANDLLWSALEQTGLMRELPVPDEMAENLEGTGVKFKIFSVTPRGMTEIADLVPRVSAQ